jgi:hypothetical protein
MTTLNLLMDYVTYFWPSILLALPNLALVVWVTTVVACRFSKMGKHTSNLVAVQYGVLAFSSLMALVFSMSPGLHHWSLTCALAGVAVFLSLSANRWRGGAPPGTMKPLHKLREEDLRHVTGGTKNP